MREAVIVAYARTPIGKAYRGAFNITHGATLTGHAIAAAVERAKVEPGEIEDAVIGCGLPEGATGDNIARQSALRAGLPVSVGGLTVSRFCSSGLQAVAVAAQQIINEGAEVMVAGGVESLSLVESPHRNRHHAEEEWLAAHQPAIYRMSMLQTAEVVANRYGISRERQDEYAAQSQQRNGAAIAEGRLSEEILPTTVRKRIDVPDQEPVFESVTLTRDEGARPNTTLDGLAMLKPVTGPDGYVTAGNASQLSDGAAALVLVERKLAERRGLPILGVYRGFVVAGCEPDEMGIGPVYAVPRLLQRHGLKVDDIDLWELNEAFASQVLYCRDRLGISNERFNVDGGAISIGHPYGMSGARMVGHALLTGRKRKAKLAVTTMCIGHGMGAAGLFEVAH
jgi:acetyl-CoA C-acetyltransferase